MNGQVQSNLYAAQQYFETVDWCDFVVWNPLCFTIDTYWMDCEWFFDWYAPREARFFFQLYLPQATEKLRAEMERNALFSTESVAARLEAAILAEFSIESKSDDSDSPNPCFKEQGEVTLKGGVESKSAVGGQVEVKRAVPTIQFEEWEDEFCAAVCAQADLLSDRGDKKTKR